MSNKAYLGDGVYVQIDRGMLKLTAEDGIRATDTIYLEGFVFNQLVRYVENIKAENKARREVQKSE